MTCQWYCKKLLSNLLIKSSSRFCAFSCTKRLHLSDLVEFSLTRISRFLLRKSVIPIEKPCLIIDTRVSCITKVVWIDLGEGEYNMQHQKRKCNLLKESHFCPKAYLIPLRALALAAQRDTWTARFLTLPLGLVKVEECSATIE
jgi:hypothetical protein